MVEVLHHARADEHGIGDGPRARRVLQQAEFEREAVAMRLQKRIHTAGVGLKKNAVARGDIFLRRFGREPQPENAFFAVHLHRVLADDF